VIPRSFIATVAGCWLLPAAAVVIRPDRDDSEYLELASRYTSSVPLNAPAGEGILVASRWVLTSAGIGKSVRDMKPRPKVAGVEVEEVHVRGDIALLQLKAVPRDLPVTALYRGRDEAGLTVAIVGHGNTDGKKRAAINTVDRVETARLQIQVKVGEERSDLQGALVPGDLGAPAIAETADGFRVVGIATSVAVDGWETYARVSSFAAWIDETMLALERKDADKLLGSDAN
jgi:secreted trypsin-like serine protease